MIDDNPPIPGFVRHGKRYRIHVNVERDVALDVAREAAERGIGAADVARERVMRVAKKKGGGK